MREKIEQFMSLVGTDKLIEQVVQDTSAHFRESLRDDLHGDEIPEDLKKALDVIETSLRASVPDLKTEIVKVYEMLIPENILDALIAFYDSEAGRLINTLGINIQTKIGSAASAWQIAAVKSVEGELAKLLGVNTSAPSPTPAP